MPSSGNDTVDMSTKFMLVMYADDAKLMKVIRDFTNSSTGSLPPDVHSVGSQEGW